MNRRRTKTKTGIYNYKTSVRKGMKKYSYRKKKPSNGLGSDVLPIKMETYHVMQIQNATNTPSIDGDAFLDVHEILTTSASWTSFASLYSRYKIKGISIYVSAAKGGYLNLSSGIPPVCFAFYPNITGVSASPAPLTNDNKLYVNPALSVPQTKYYSFPDGYFDGGTTGYGMWTQTSSVGSQVGLIGFTPTILSLSSGGNSLIYHLKTVVYVVLSDKVN